MNDVDTFYKDCIFLYDDADGQPLTMNSGGSALGRIMDLTWSSNMLFIVLTLNFLSLCFTSSSLLSEAATTSM